MKAPNMFGSLLAVGITSLIGIQAIINIAVVTSSMPATGMPLPFFSYGGTALFILLCEVGILLNVSRAGNKWDSIYIIDIDIFTKNLIISFNPALHYASYNF